MGAKMFRHTARPSKHGLDRQTLRENLDRLGYTSYRQYLNSPHWRTMRQRFKDAGLHSCQWCGGRPIQLHHKTYVRLGHEKMTDLMPLCKLCHRGAHRKGVLKRKPNIVWSDVTVYYREPEPRATPLDSET